MPIAPGSDLSLDRRPVDLDRLDHEIGLLKELLEAKENVAEARFQAMDKAVALIEKFPTAIDIAVGHLQALHEEKFAGVGVRFNELNTRLTEGDRYKQTALDAALKAAQTLVDIQNVNFKETIKKTEELFGKQILSLQETVDDLKGIVRSSGGAHLQRADSSQLLFSIIMAAVAVVSLGMILMEKFSK